MTIELFKGEDEILLSLLGEEYKKLGIDDQEKGKQIYRIMERIELTQRLYQNMYGRGNK